MRGQGQLCDRHARHGHRGRAGSEAVLSWVYEALRTDAADGDLPAARLAVHGELGLRGGVAEHAFSVPEDELARFQVDSKRAGRLCSPLNRGHNGWASRTVRILAGKSMSN